MKTKIGGTITRGEEILEFNIIGVKKRNEKGLILELMMGDRTHPQATKVEEIYIPEKMVETLVKIMSENLSE